MNAIITYDQNSEIRQAEMMASAKLMPAHLQRSPGDCMMIIDQARRWRMSPFAVAQCTAIVKGKLMYEGKLVAAALNSSGILSDRLNYEFSGSGQDRKCVASATLNGEAKARTIDVVLKDVVTENGIWKKQPDQQLTYSAARIWARRHAPEVMLGVYTPEEFDAAPRVVQSNDDGVIDGKAEAPDPEPAAPRKQTVTEWLDALEAKLVAAETAEAVDDITAQPDVQKALDKLTNGALARLNTMIKAALDRTAAPAADGEEWPGATDEMAV